MDVASLETVAVPAMRRAIQERSIVVVDEIGKMELLSPVFMEALLEVLNSGKRLLGTITLQPDSLADRIKRDPRVQVILLSRSNRQLVLGEVKLWLQAQGASSAE